MSQGLPGIILSKFGLNSPRKVARMTSWERVAQEVDDLNGADPAKAVHIAVVGKYTHLSDAYLSVIRALQHSAQFVHRKLAIDWIESLYLEDAAKVRAAGSTPLLLFVVICCYTRRQYSSSMIPW